MEAIARYIAEMFAFTHHQATDNDQREKLEKV